MTPATSLHHAAGTEFIGRSEAFLTFLEELGRAAQVNRPALLIGERGTGKELAAARLHFMSRRWQGEFVTMNCAALAPSLLESELFGYEAGAFTGATARRAGKFETADNGTLFLDEIGALSLTAQEKILRAVEYGVFERVGRAGEIGVDVRIIGATNADLPQLAGEGKFKRDLLDRLSFAVLHLPPLRERAEDIPLLANHFASRMAVEMDMEDVPEFSPQAMDTLLAHPWPGNVRELKNVVERAVFASPEGLIDTVKLDPFASPYRPMRTVPPAAAKGADAPPASARLDIPLPRQVEELKIALLREALRQGRYNQKTAARLLGLTYNQFRALYRKLGKRLETEER